jgi:hypothetical protein
LVEVAAVKVGKETAESKIKSDRGGVHVALL